MSDTIEQNENNNTCKCDFPTWSEIKRKSKVGGTVEGTVPLLLYQVCKDCGFIRILAN